MERGVRSSEGFIKKKSSSGCLIIKKKISPSGCSGGVGPLPRKVFGSNEERERRSFGVSISGSSEDSLEQGRREILPRDERFYNGSVMYGESIVGNNGFGWNGKFEGERRRKFVGVEFDDNVGMYRKRTKVDNEDGYEIRRGFETESCGYGMNGNSSPYFCAGSVDEALLPVSPVRQKSRVPSDKPIRVQGKNGVLKVMVNKSKNAHILRQFYEKYMEDVDRSGSTSEIAVNTNLSVGPSLYLGPKHPENGNSSVRMWKSAPKLQNSFPKRANTGDSETDGGDFSLKPKSTGMVNKSKDMHMTYRSYDFQQQDLVRRGSNLEIDVNKNAPVTPSFFLDSKILQDGNSLPKAEKSEIKLQNSLSKRINKDKSEDSDSSLKREPRNEQVGSFSKGVRSEEKTPSAGKAISGRGKETKVKRGTGTEKQLLREKIRHILITSGWTINYRPRKNRDYLDAVYINPAGTAYWSIIKAYEAFKKQVGEEDVPEELLNKLTRQTRKKMEKEMKMKQREEARGKIGNDVEKEEAEEDTENDDNDEKLSFSDEQNGKSLKRKAEKPSTDKNSQLIPEKKTPQIGRRTMLVRSSDKGSKSQNDGYVPYMGKRTLLSWLIDSGTVRESAEVQYMNRKQTKVMLKGWIARDGIHCGCCSKIVTVSKFEIHAGSKLRQPFQNIYLESGVSLLQCQIEAWNRQDKAKRCGFHNLNIDGDDGNDDACGLCGDGGDLMCCDGCPSTFHQSCMGIQTLPPGDWHCPNCTCKFCERSSAQGNALIMCRMCERKYHELCKEEIVADVDRESTSFCGKKCQEVFNQLQKLLEVKHELEAGFSWSLIHRTDIDTDVSQHGFPQKVECNSKLAVALSVIEECFLPINDRRSGINLIHNVLYNRGSNYCRLNHSGFYTAILERGDEIVAAASIRIHGTQLAEMPFIGTRHIYRRQGMCRRLLSAIESALSSLEVEKLIIPAIAEHMHTWTGVFGFDPLEEPHKKEMRSLKMLVFPRTDMLQKVLVEQIATERHLTTESDTKSILSKEQQRLMPVVTEICQCDTSLAHDSNACDNASLESHPKTDDRTVAIDSCLRVTVSNGNASSDSSSDVPSASDLKVSSKNESNGVSFDAQIVNLEIEIPVLNSSVEGHSSEDGIAEDVHANIKVAEQMLVSPGTDVEEVKEDQDYLLNLTSNGTDETFETIKF